MGCKEFKRNPLFHRYEVSSDGTVRKVDGRLELRVINRNDTKYVSIVENGIVKNVSVYKLLLITFNPYGLTNLKRYLNVSPHMIRFKDGNLNNLTVDNIKIDDRFKYVLLNDDISILTTHPEGVKRYWDFEKNSEEEIYPENYTYGSIKKVNWRCEEGHTYKEKIVNQITRLRCKVCDKYNRVSIPQQVVFNVLKDNFTNVILEKSIGKYSIDIYIEDLNISVEYDGESSHTQLNLRKDLIREEYIKRITGCKFIRFREYGCADFGETSSCIIMYDYKKDVRFKDLIDKVNNLVVELKGYSKGSKDDYLDVNANTIWGRVESNLKENCPKLIKFYSNKNNTKYDKITYGTRLEFMWECPKCGSEWCDRPYRMISRNYYCKKCKDSFKDNINDYKKVFYKNRKKERGTEFKLKCGFCGKNFTKMSKARYCSTFCRKQAYPKKEKKFNPSKEELIKRLKETPNLTDVGGYYGVSGVAVKKRCKDLKIDDDINYWTNLYHKDRGYSYQTYKNYVKLRNKRPEVLEYLVKNYTKLSRNEIVLRRKIVGLKLYNAIGIIHQFK